MVLNEDGSINGEESYATLLDQAEKYHTMQQSDGTDYEVQGGVHRKVTFSSLYKNSYIPFTIKEFLGTDPVEKAEAKLDIEIGDSVTVKDLQKATITSTSTMSHCIVTVVDKDNKEIYKYTSYLGQGEKSVASFTYALSKAIFPASLSAHAGKGNTIVVKMWVGSGECLELVNANLSK